MALPPFLMVGTKKKCMNENGMKEPLGIGNQNWEFFSLKCPLKHFTSVVLKTQINTLLKLKNQPAHTQIMRMLVVT